MDVGILERNKDKFLEYKEYWEQVARDSKDINHTDDDKHFVRYSMSEIFSSKQNGLKSPYLGLETPSFKTVNDNGENVQIKWQGAIVIGHHYEKGNQTSKDKAFDECCAILLKILGRVNRDRRTDRLLQFDLNDLQINEVNEMFGEPRTGVRWSFQMNSQFDLGYYASDWHNADDADPQPPFATVTDGANQVELFFGDAYTCSTSNGNLILKDSAGNIIATVPVPPGSDVEQIAPDATANLKDSAGGALSSTSIVSGGNQNITAPDATANLKDSAGNAISTTSIKSNESKNITAPDGAAKNSLGDTVATVRSGAEANVANSAITVNTQALAALPATEPLDVLVRYQNGTPVGTVVAGVVEIPNQNPIVVIPTLTIGVYSDIGLTNPITTADFGQTIYFHIATDLDTPTSYRFFVCNQNMVFTLTTQATATLAHTVSTFNDIVILAEAVNATNVIGAQTFATVEINADVTALAYVAQHNTLSGFTMATPQQEMAQTFYQMMKGTGTTNGSDLHTKMVNSNSVIIAFTPVSNTQVSLAPIAINLVDPSEVLPIVGFSVADVAIDGVTGGTGKYIRMSRSPSTFGQNDVAVHAWGRGAASGSNLTAIGCQTGGSSVLLVRISTSNGAWAVNDAGKLKNTDGLGLHTSMRRLSSTSTFYKEGALSDSNTVASQTPSAQEIYAFAFNNNGSASQFYPRKLALVAATCSFTDAEYQDFTEMMNFFANNMDN